MTSETRAFDHDVPAGGPSGPPPLVLVDSARQRSAAEESRTLVSATHYASLSTLSEDGQPWGSMVMYVPLADGSPVLCVSTLAEHGRNLERDPRASLVVAQTGVDGDPLAAGRVTLAGVVSRPEGDVLEAAREAYLAAVPAARVYAEFGDFSFWVLDVQRVRWVGGYGRMDSADAESYRLAEPDPVAPSAAYAVKHLNEDHADALLAMARVLGGHPDADEARCTHADRYGLDLDVGTSGGSRLVRIGFAEPITAPDGLRAATVELAKRARA